VLQSCPRITALRETLLSRIQRDPGTSSQISRTLDRDFVRYPSVASRQTALLNVARQQPLQRSSTITSTFPPLRNASSNGRDAPEDGLTNNRDELGIDWPGVCLSDCHSGLEDGLSNHGEEPESVLPNDGDGPKWDKLEDGPTNLREVQKDELCVDSTGSDCGPSNVGNFQESGSECCGEKADERLYEGDCEEMAENASCNSGNGPDSNSRPNYMSSSVLSTTVDSVDCDSPATEPLPESRHFV